MSYNPERFSWRGRSFKNGRRVRELRADLIENEGDDLPEETPVPNKSFVVLVRASGREHNRIFCETAAEAIVDFTAMHQAWKGDHRLEYIEIRDVDGNLFRPTIDTTSTRRPQYGLPLLEVSL